MKNIVLDLMMGGALLSNGYNTCWIDIYTRRVRRMALYEKTIKEMFKRDFYRK